jgi:predicted GIY-YIG superfamily endonuclease
MLMYYTYVLKINNEFYIGYTDDLRRRVKQHRAKGEVELVYYEAYLYKKSATTREKKLKHYGSAWRALKKRITA